MIFLSNSICWLPLLKNFGTNVVSGQIKKRYLLFGGITEEIFQTLFFACKREGERAKRCSGE
jgi:hypothetical protein